MNLMDGLFLTLINVVVCLAFPKLLSVILNFKNKRLEASQATLSSTNAKSDVPSFS
jgi:hypothetical protein